MSPDVFHRTLPIDSTLRPYPQPCHIRKTDKTRRGTGPEGVGSPESKAQVLAGLHCVFIEERNTIYNNSGGGGDASLIMKMRILLNTVLLVMRMVASRSSSSSPRWQAILYACSRVALSGVEMKGPGFFPWEEPPSVLEIRCPFTPYPPPPRAPSEETSCRLVRCIGNLIDTDSSRGPA